MSYGLKAFYGGYIYPGHDKVACKTMTKVMETKVPDICALAG